VASTQVQVWGDEAPKEMGCGKGVFLSRQEKGSERGQCSLPINFACFVISKRHILVNSEVLNLKYVGRDSNWRSPTKILGDVCPASPAGLTPVWAALQREPGGPIRDQDFICQNDVLFCFVSYYVSYRSLFELTWYSLLHCKKSFFGDATLGTGARQILHWLRDSADLKKLTLNLE